MHDEKAVSKERRDFLMKCGKFAVVTPPAVALMLSTAGNKYATAASNNGFGNGGGDGTPGNSGNNPSPNSAQKAEDEVR